jgi:hypothetical protein
LLLLLLFQNLLLEQVTHTVFTPFFIYPQCFLKNMPHLCKYMPDPKDARRQIPDPDNEPHFDELSRLHPLPEKVGGQPKPAAALPAEPPRIQAPRAPQQPANQASLFRARLASEVFGNQLPPPKRLALTASSLTPATTALPTTFPHYPSAVPGYAQLPVAQSTSFAARQHLLGFGLSAPPPSSNHTLESALRERLILAAIKERQQAQQQLKFQQAASLGLPENASASTIGEYLRMQSFR